MTTNPAMLTKAVLRAAENLGLLDALPEILGIDQQRFESMVAGDEALSPESTEWDIATRFAGLFRSLLSMLTNADEARAWLQTPHSTLGAAPSQLLRTPEGRDRVFKYLDAIQKFEIKLPPRGMSH